MLGQPALWPAWLKVASGLNPLLQALSVLCSPAACKQGQPLRVSPRGGWVCYLVVPALRCCLQVRCRAGAAGSHNVG